MRGSAPVTIGYAHASLAVRRELPAAHERFWKRLAAPGAWFTATERVGIAGEARRARGCSLCRERKAALSPSSVAGEHDHLGQLKAPVVEAVHRLVTDPGRLTRKWLDGLVAAGLSLEAYVEIVGTVAALVSIDSFCRGIGVPAHRLPEPDAGAPSRVRPESAREGEAWVPMIPAGGATGAEANLFPEGFVPNVARAMSVVPDEVRTLIDLSTAHYLPAGRVADPTAPGYSLSRSQMELVAARVSALNQCFY